MRSQSAAILLVLSILVCVGSMGPWASVLFFSVAGTEGDGVITLIIGVVAALIAGFSLTRPSNGKFLVMALLLGGAALIGIYDWAELERLVDSTDPFRIEVGWGLVLMTVAAGAGCVLSFASLGRRHQVPPPPEERETLPALAPYTPPPPASGYRGPAGTGERTEE